MELGEHGDQPRTRQLGGKFKTAEEVVVDDVARDARREDITHAPIERSSGAARESMQLTMLAIEY